MVTEEEFTKVVNRVADLSEDMIHVRQHEFLMQARLKVLTEIAEVSLSSAQGITREDAQKVIRKTVRKEYERMPLAIGDTSPQFAELVDLDPERPLE